MCFFYEKCIVDFENGCYGFVFVFGMVVIFVVIDFFFEESYVIVMDDIYGGMFWFFECVWKLMFGLMVFYVDLMEFERVFDVVCLEMWLIWIEMLINFLLKVVDIEMVV